jgi:hypothetical protein
MTGKGKGHLVVAVLALASQLVAPASLWLLSVLAYGQPRYLDEAWERPVSLAVLGGCAGVSLALGVGGAYGLLSRSRPWVAAVLLLTCCVPALLGGAVYLHALLLFLTAV